MQKFIEAKDKINTKSPIRKYINYIVGDFVLIKT